MRIVAKQLRLELRGFRYKVALCLSHRVLSLATKFKDNPFEFQAQFRIILSSVTQMYCDKMTVNRITRFSLRSS